MQWQSLMSPKIGANPIPSANIFIQSFNPSLPPLDAVMYVSGSSRNPAVLLQASRQNLLINTPSTYNSSTTVDLCVIDSCIEVYECALGRHATRCAQNDSESKTCFPSFHHHQIAGFILLLLADTQRHGP
jgi:hypothetical protein